MLKLVGKRGGLCGLIVLCPLLSACAQQALREDTIRGSGSATHADFGGSWEMDYVRSDDVSRQLTELFRNMSSSAQSAAARSDSRSSNIVVGLSAGTVESVVALARLAESITRSQVLEIAQNANEIEVKREDDFTLTCEYFERTPRQVETLFGTELCGWDGDRMVFHVSLPDGLTISHRMTLAPDGKKLHIATTVASAAAPVPFTLSRFYDRFEPLPSDYECEYTLSKHKVCRTRRSDP